MIDGNDGGLNITYDGGDSWRFIDNIPVGQYYHVNVDNQIPYNIYGGMQDNGSWQGPAYVWRSGGIRNAYWEELYFGDGFDVMMDPSDDRYAYAMSQQGNIGRVDLETGAGRFVRPTHPEGEVLRFNWNSPVNFDPFDDETIYFGSQYVHKSTDRGESWEIISPDLTTNDTTKQKQHESGGITMDATGAENFTTLLAIEPSPLEEGLIWTGSDDGKVHITRNGGQEWTDVTKNIKGIPSGSWVAQVKASTFDAGTAVAVINNYRRDDWGVYVMKTTNYGKSWNNITKDKGLEGYALSYVQDLEEPNLMFVGTELGLYVTIDGGNNWTKWTNGYPTVSTYDMVIHPREHDLVIGTFGRAFWVLDDIRPLRDLAKNGADQLEKAIRVFPAPDAYQAEWRQARGMRFAADGVYSGDNRPSGARFTYSVNSEMLKSEGEEKKSNSKEKVTIEIFDSSGERIRTFDRTPERDGINRTIWRMDRAGKRGASRRKARPNSPEPSGGDVLPGIYKVKFTYGDFSDSTMVTVKSDPRIEVTMAALRASAQLRDDITDLNATLAKGTDQLIEAQEIVDTYQALAKADSRDKEELKEINEANKEISKKIEDLMDMVFGKPDDRQGITRNPAPNTMQAIFAPFRYLGSDYDGPGKTEENLLRLAREEVDKALTEINQFFEEDWSTYQQKMEAADFKLFKDFETVDMD